jgi:hypothetical protein
VIAIYSHETSHDTSTETDLSSWKV